MKIVTHTIKIELDKKLNVTGTITQSLNGWDFELSNGLTSFDGKQFKTFEACLAAVKKSEKTALLELELMEKEYQEWLKNN